METTEKPKVNVAAQMRQTAVSAAISGALMLFFGALARRYYLEEFAAVGSWMQKRGMILVPDARVRYEDVVHIMDAAREQKIEGIKVTLFPDVVLSSIVGADEKPKPGRR